ncbi:type I restriction endonuclease subunit R [Ignatzschineria sp. LJL83]
MTKRRYTSEREIEDRLIAQLVAGDSQWTYRKDLTDEASLWQNFRIILERNNLAILNGEPLTELEFRQVQNQLRFSNFYEAATWLSGENGIAKVEVRREDATLGTIRLNVIHRDHIAGGKTVYEVVNQFEADKKVEMDRNRIFDVTLLINGLPMIHIELKNRQHPYMDGFRQIQKYLKEGKFTGIYSTLQMFVVSNASDTRYIAAAQFEKLNAKFLSKWVTATNQEVNDYIHFAEDVLSIPAAHKMVMQYSITDREKEALILLRPYQIHAIEAVKEASFKQESGYVWHTTGSGKTLTSYKVACNLLHIPVIDKTIFIVDRVDLDQQTTSSFASYAEFDPVSIDETANVNDLIDKLANDDRTVVITTIQKLNHLMRRIENSAENGEVSERTKKRYAKIKAQRIAFIVDECHRAVTPEKKQELQRYFHHSLWYGFTGTPIFEENQRASLGNLARTTQELYGNRLHQYTVQEAIKDGAVLGFQVEYKHTFDEYELEQIIEQRYPDKDYRSLTPIEREKLIPREAYNTKEHRLQVIDFIINKSHAKLGFTAESGVGKAYGAILTVPNIATAQEYYDLIKSVVAGNETVKVGNRTSKILPDFPKIAITYSISENEESSIQNQEKMKEALQDYNATYEKNYSLETIKAYNQNVNARLARKKALYHQRREQIDLIIVVDRLLTGFDAPCISTLFIDRPPMQPHDIIQAFSRTNRLFDRDKLYGQIVTFQTPRYFEKQVNEALFLYSNGGENHVLAPVWEEVKQELIEAIEALRIIARTPEEIKNLSLEEKREFVRAFQKVDRFLNSAMVYSNFKPEMMGDIFPIDFMEIEEYHGIYVNVLEELRENREEDPDVEPLDIEYDLQTHRVEEINYNYIVALIQEFIPEESSPKEMQSDALANQEVDDYVETLKQENPQLAGVMSLLWQEIRSTPEEFRGQRVTDLLAQKIDIQTNELVENFSKQWALDPEEFRYMVASFNPDLENQPGEEALKRSANFDLYKSQAENPVSKLRYWRTVKEAYTKMITEDVLPLRVG